MKLSNLCKNYFNGFQQISNFKKNTKGESCLAALKILSYFTLVIPAAVFGIGCLCGRIKKTSTTSKQDQKVKASTSPIFQNDPNNKKTDPIQPKPPTPSPLAQPAPGSTSSVINPSPSAQLPPSAQSAAQPRPSTANPVPRSSLPLPQAPLSTASSPLATPSQPRVKKNEKDPIATGGTSLQDFADYASSNDTLYRLKSKIEDYNGISFKFSKFEGNTLHGTLTNYDKTKFSIKASDIISISGKGKTWKPPAEETAKV